MGRWANAAGARGLRARARQRAGFAIQTGAAARASFETVNAVTSKPAPLLEPIKCLRAFEVNCFGSNFAQEKRC